MTVFGQQWLKACEIGLLWQIFMKMVKRSYPICTEYADT